MYSKEAIEQTKAHWEPQYGRSLSDAEAEEIIRNVTSFFDILHEWDMKRKQELEE